MKLKEIFENFDWGWIKDFDFERNTLSLCLVGLSFSTPWSLPALFRSLTVCYKARLEYRAKVLEIDYKVQKKSEDLKTKAGKRLKTG